MTRGFISQTVFDLFVVGSGPAGVACALQAARDELSLVWAGTEPVGGLVPAARKIVNLPGCPSISGCNLARILAAQCRDRNLSPVSATVTAMVRLDTGFRLDLDSGDRYFARTVCLATGTHPSPVPFPLDDGCVHRDIRSLPQSLSGRTVLVVGGGEAALDSALSARDRDADVMVLARSEFRAAPFLIQACRHRGVTLMEYVPVETILRRSGQWCLTTSARTTVRGHELLICIGRTPDTRLIQNLLPAGHPPTVIQPDLPGLFLAGDVIRSRDRYIATAMGDGQAAAVAASRYTTKEFHP